MVFFLLYCSSVFYLLLLLLCVSSLLVLVLWVLSSFFCMFLLVFWVMYSLLGVSSYSEFSSFFWFVYYEFFFWVWGSSSGCFLLGVGLMCIKKLGHITTLCIDVLAWVMCLEDIRLLVYHHYDHTNCPGVRQHGTFRYSMESAILHLWYLL